MEIEILMKENNKLIIDEENKEENNEIKKGRGRPKNNIKKSSKENYMKFKENHEGILTQKIECSICSGSYTYYTKSTHLKSKKHIAIEKKYNKK